MYGVLQVPQLLDKTFCAAQISNVLGGVEIIMTLKEGDLIGVPCSIQLGPFPHEKLIAVETTEGPLYGFATETNLAQRVDERGLVKGRVMHIASDSVTVRLFGSFFTTALGVTSVKPGGLTRLVAQ